MGIVLCGLHVLVRCSTACQDGCQRKKENATGSIDVRCLGVLCINESKEVQKACEGHVELDRRLSRDLIVYDIAQRRAAFETLVELGDSAPHGRCLRGM